jgi:hypothetical protein
MPATPVVTAIIRSLINENHFLFFKYKPTNTDNVIGSNNQIISSVVSIFFTYNDIHVRPSVSEVQVRDSERTQCAG